MAAPPRRRIVAIVDGVVAIAAFLGLYNGLMQLGSMVGDTNALLSSILWVGPCILWLAVLLALAWSGQTPGLVLPRLRWVDQHGATARWRPAGEPQFWCGVLPTLWVLLMLPGAAARTLIGPDNAPSFWVATSTFDNVIGPILVLGVLACMAVSRRHPGRLISCR